MSFDRDEFEKLKTAHAPKEDRTNLRMIQQAAVAMDLMTTDAAWDKFLSYIQAQIENSTKRRATIVTDIASPTLTSSDQIALRRNEIFRLDEQIRTLNWVIAMPSQLKQLGDVAVQKLKTLTEDETEETQAA